MKCLVFFTLFPVGNLKFGTSGRHRSNLRTRSSGYSSLGGSDDDPNDPEARRKRQRYANLQAQRRCRERHRNHVSTLEQENKELCDKLAKQEDEVKRLKQALQKSQTGLEECQLKTSGADSENVKLIKEKSELERKLRVCSMKNSELEAVFHKIMTIPC